ncbi:hypothetical protein F3D3_2508 [Fusibacter sp. 3D3]|nr:hypothetical protein F3D3_2508 [Fusibacter sp. 3D3]
MAKFDEVISEYNRLIKSRCEFLLDDGTLINLVFEEKNLPHLLGFQYLSDAHTVFRVFNDKNDRSVIAENIMSKIITENVSYEQLTALNKVDGDVRRRIEEFSYTNIIGLLRGITTFKFIYEPKRQISNKARFVFIEHRDELFIHLYIGYDKLQKNYFPLSFQPSKRKEVSLERKPHYIIKTTIYHDKENGVEIEVLDHVVMRPVIRDLSEGVKKYKSINDLLYKKISDGQETSKFLNEVNECFRFIERKYNELSTLINLDEFLMRRSNAKMKSFFDDYRDKFCKH